MKTVSFFLFTFCLAFSIGCQRSEEIVNNDPDPVFSATFFNQNNTTFRNSQISCLLNQWYGGTYKNEPIAFRVINDQSAYTTFFACNSTTPLPAIDFTKNSLLIGMKADYGQFLNTPVNVNHINQTLIPTSNGNYSLQVMVTGQAGKNLGQGGEWFGFASLVPKLSGTVSLDMQYQFK